MRATDSHDISLILNSDSYVMCRRIGKQIIWKKEGDQKDIYIQNSRWLCFQMFKRICDELFFKRASSSNVHYTIFFHHRGISQYIPQIFTAISLYIIPSFMFHQNDSCSSSIILYNPWFTSHRIYIDGCD